MKLSLDEKSFIKKASSKTVTPLYCNFYCDSVTPVSFYQLIGSPYSFILESVENSESVGRFSIIGMGFKKVLENTDKKTKVQYESGAIKEYSDKPFDVLREHLNEYHAIDYDGDFGFMGGGVGFLSYDTVQNIESRVKSKNFDNLEVPDSCFIWPKTVVVFDHFKRQVRLVYNAYIDDEKNAATLYKEAKKSLEELLKKFNSVEALSHQQVQTQVELLPYESNVTKEKFQSIVAEAKKQIVAGEAIQIVLSQQFKLNISKSDFEIYRSLRMVNPSPYLFLIRFPEFSLVGSSPEVMVKETKGKVSIRPIAGTRHRGETVEEDEMLKDDLLSDEKEIAEHVMLVDLARNDISRVCKSGSVKLDQKMIVEKYSHVMHIVSNVVGELREDCDAIDLLRATFPAGTVSGAPKVRAMEIIDSLETLKRGPYAGAICYFDHSGNFDSCITIRTCLLKDSKAFVQAGAGIVFDSVPEKEYQETINKAKALMTALSLAENNRKER